MRMWLKGGILLALIYLLVQFLDDFFIVFFGTSPFELVRVILYFGTTNFYYSFIGRCGSLHGLCGIAFIVLLGFVTGAIIGAVAGTLKMEKRRRKILKEHEELKKGGFLNLLKEQEKKLEIEKIKNGKEKKKEYDEEELPEIEIIPLETKKVKRDKKFKKRRNKRN